MAMDRIGDPGTDKQQDVDRRDKRQAAGRSTQEINGVKIVADQNITQKDIQTLTAQAAEEWAKNGKSLTHLDLSRADKTREIIMVGASREMSQEQVQGYIRAKEVAERERLEKMKSAEIKKAKDDKERTVPAVKDLPRNAHSKIRYLAYAKEARIQGCIKDTDKAIIIAMAKNGEKAQTITETLKHSPAYLTHDEAGKHLQARQLTQSVLRDTALQKQLTRTIQKDRGISR